MYSTEQTHGIPCGGKPLHLFGITPSIKMDPINKTKLYFYFSSESQKQEVHDLKQA